MKHSNHLLHAAIGGLLALGATAATTQAFADSVEMEQCAGVIRSGMNDCATSKNACHGHVMTDADPEAWIYVPTGTCERIAGARVVTVVDPTPASKRK